MRGLRALVPLTLLLASGCNTSAPGTAAVTDGGGAAITPPPPPPPPPPANMAPVASAGAAQTVDEGQATQLDGSASNDAEDGSALTYAWTQIAGSAATLTGADTATPHFAAPAVPDDSVLDFKLTVTDSKGAQSSDVTHVKVRHFVPGLSQYLKPFTGTLPPGFVDPGPFAPFGMVHVGPDTEGPLNYGGYSYNNAFISGFSHVHMSAGVFKGGEIPFMPLTGDVTPGDLASTGYPGNAPAYSSPYTHVLESAKAGYYSVTLLRYGVKAELTATPRAAMHRYTYQAPGQTPRLLIDVSRDLRGHHAAKATMRADGTLLGSVTTDDVGGYTVYFAAKFSAPYTAQTLDGAALTADHEVSGDTLGVLLDFASLSGPLVSKIGLSYVDTAGALNNLNSEIPGMDFDAVRAQSVSAWDHQLAKLAVTGGTDFKKQSFYTALSRALEFPNLFSDVDGRYAGAEDVSVIHQDAHPHYSEYSLWDSIRGQNALIAELEPAIYRDMVASLLDFARQHGRLPRWQQAQRDAGHMSGDPAITFVGEAWCRGNSDAATRDELYQAMGALTQLRADQIKLGYKPVEPPGQGEQYTGGDGGAGTTLEFGLADFSLALIAQAAGHATDAQTYQQRSLNYRNLMDPDGSGFIRPRLADGSWLTPFNPKSPYGFQEGTSWQYSWLAQHDVAGLVTRMGGGDTVLKHLDTFFQFPLDRIPLLVPMVQDERTVFGTVYYSNQYVPGNEDDLEAPYLYNYLGAPWKTQIVSRSASSIYLPNPLGLPGNDDLGALSGWLVWNMLGVYPINPGAPLYVFGSPQFDKVVMRRPAGDFVIEAPGAQEFISGVTVNGQPLEKTWLILPRAATTLGFATVAQPDKTWGTAAGAAPPSISTADLSSFGCEQ